MFRAQKQRSRSIILNLSKTICIYVFNYVFSLHSYLGLISGTRSCLWPADLGEFPPSGPSGHFGCSRPAEIFAFKSHLIWHQTMATPIRVGPRPRPHGSTVACCGSTGPTVGCGSGGALKSGICPKSDPCNFWVDGV